MRKRKQLQPSHIYDDAVKSNGTGRETLHALMLRITKQMMYIEIKRERESEKTRNFVLFVVCDEEDVNDGKRETMNLTLILINVNNIKQNF